MSVFDSLASFVGVPPAPLVAAFVISFFAAAVQGTIGFGYGLISVPTLALLHPALAPVPQLVCAMPLVLHMAWRERAGIDWSGFGWITVGRFPGTAAGVLMVGALDPRSLDLVMAGIIAVAVAASVSRARAVRVRGAPFWAGLASGLTSYVSAIGGPPVALLYRDATGPTLRATLAAVFAVGLVITIAGRVLVGQLAEVDLRVSAVLLPGVLLGSWASGALTGRVEGPRLRAAVLWGSGLASVALAARTLLGG
ncbi:MAG: sulfite exporter TauE/SafE family protein [bacterium]